MSIIYHWSNIFRVWSCKLIKIMLKFEKRKGGFSVENIKIYRKMAGFTQEMLSEAICVSPETLSRYERGTRSPRLRDLEKIAKALGVTLTDLIGKEVNSDDND